MKKILTSVLMVLALSGCGGGDDEQKNTELPEGFKMHQGEDFSLLYPSGWEVILPGDFVSDIPSGTLVGFQRTPKDEVFTPNIGVLKNELPKEVSSLDYAKGLMERHKSALLNYKELAREEMQVEAGGKSFSSFFVKFEGKEKPDADMKIFHQVSVVKKDEAYVATGAYLRTAEAELQEFMTEAVKSLKVK